MITLVTLALAVQNMPAAPSAGPLPAESATAADQFPTPPVIPPAEAVSSTGFVLSQPRLHVAGDTVRLDGTVCRRPNRSLISPTRVQIDHLSASGEPLDTSYAYLPAIRQREDQRCAHYGAKLKTPFGAGDTVRVCLARRQGTCAKRE